MSMMTHLVQRAYIAAGLPGLVCLITCLSLGLDKPAKAQVRMASGFEEALQPDFLRRDLGLFNDQLRLDKDQRSVVATLFSDYESAFAQGVQDVRSHLAGVAPRLGVTDPETERRQEDLRERLSEAIEEFQSAGENLSPEDRQELRAKLQAQSQEIRRELERLRPAQLDREQLQQRLDEAAVQIEAWQVRKAQLRDEFVQNLQVALRDDQRDLWPGVDRRLLRERTLPRGRLSGESVDLVQIAAQAPLSEADRQAIAPTLEEYSVKLDDALRQRNDCLARTQRELLQAFQGRNPGAGRPLLQQQVELRIAVRNVNDQYAQVIASQLSEPAAAAFTASYRERGYSRIYRTTQAQRVFKAAQELPDLSNETRESIQELELAYTGELAAMNERVLEVLRANEPTTISSRGEQRLEALAGGPGLRRSRGQLSQPGGPDPVTQEFAKRNEMGQRYVQQIQALLTPEQFQRLPWNGGGNEARGAQSRQRGGAGADGRRGITAEFDTNGDGRLDDAERQAIREFLRNRRNAGADESADDE